MIITDHINLFPEHPLRGKNFPELGTRFPDMSDAYSSRLIKQALKIAEEKGIRVMQGVYIGTQVPRSRLRPSTAISTASAATLWA